MQKHYLITIVGTQNIDGEDDRIEVITTATYEEKNGEKIIRYCEYTDDEAKEKIDTTVTVKGENQVIIERKGAASSRLTLEKGRRHQCHYETVMGPMMIGVYTSEIHDTLSPSGGELKAGYELDFFSGFASENEFFIKLKEHDPYVKNES